MKNLNSFLLILSLVSMLVGCAKNDTNSVPSDNSSTTSKQETEKRAVLEIKAKYNEIKKFRSDRPYDPKKEDVSIILVTGQSNFTSGVGYDSELGYYNRNKNTAPYPEMPIYPPTADIVYTSTQFGNLTELSSNQSYSESNPGSGVSPAFGTKWSALTGTKTVFIQAARGGSGMHEWTPNPGEYICTCPSYGNGLLYVNAIENYKTTYIALSEKYNIVYTGYIFNQGEHDEFLAKEGNTIHDSDSYYAAYKSMHDGFMEELNLDFGGISVVRADGKGDTAENSMSLTVARTAQYQLCNEIDNLFMLSTISETCDLSMMDAGSPTHYSQATFNKMGTEMAQNLYSALGLGPTNAYEGVKIYASNGTLISEFDANSNLKSGKATIERSDPIGESLIKLSALGTGHTLSFSLKVGDKDASSLINGYGNINWTELYKQHSLRVIDVTVTIE